MATLKTKFSVGLFLICGMGMIIIGIIWLGMSNYLEKGRLFVAYFDESVQGLEVDSPVKYRGVRVGRVHSISVAPDERLIEVVLKIESDIKDGFDTKNLIAKLKSVGITGLMFIELEHYPKEISPPALSFQPQLPVIATRPSEISKFFQGIDDIFHMIRSLDTQTISDQIVTTLAKINQTIDDAQLDKLVTDLHTTVGNLQKALNTEKIDHLFDSLTKTSNNFNQMTVNADNGISEIRQVVNRLDGVIQTSGGDLQDMTHDLKAASQDIRTAIEKMAILLEGTDQRIDYLQRQAAGTLSHIEQATDALNRFLDHLANQPSQVIFSAPVADKP